ncbi:polyketide synthase, partial [Fusarium phyllophilum]
MVESSRSGVLTKPTVTEVGESPRGIAPGDQPVQSGQPNATVDAPEAPQIAICGIALRLPGGISNCQDYWDLLYHGIDARSPIPSSRFNIDGFDGSLGGKDSIKFRHGYFIEDDLSCLDTSFFSITKSELDRVDPQQRLLLEVTQECLDDAGEVNYHGKQIGCYVGTFGDDWSIMNDKESVQGGVYVTTGGTDIMMANRTSYEFDLQGPSEVIKTGCSSSAVALHEACRAIQRGDASSAIVGGASLIMTPAMTTAMSVGEVLAPDASCKTFDAAADGYARAEAITAIYIKPLSDAIRDGNPIRAIVRATAVNCDGKSVSLVTPNGAAHEALMRKAYRDVGLDPKDTAFVECHGTGTATGDPIETTAVGKVFGEGKPVYITSVKPNLGHSEGAAALSAIIKCVLALEHQIIPPNIKLKNPNPKIPFAKYNLNVPLEPTPFPPDRQKRVSASSFGIGGSNAHVILESYSLKTNEASPSVNQKTSGSNSLLLLSANTETSLQKQVLNYQHWIDRNPEHVADAGYTLARHRKHLPHRAFIVSQHGKSIDISAPSKISSSLLPLVFVFSGQGNYKAGCTFLESFCQYRHSLGLPASVLSICGIEDVGYLAENPYALRSVKLQGLYTVREKEFLESVEVSLFHSAPSKRTSINGGFGKLSSPWENSGHIIMGMRSYLHLDDPKNPTNWRRDRRMGAYHNLPTADQADTRGESSQLKVFLQSISEGDAIEVLAKEESIDFLSIEIGTKVNDFLLRPDGPIDPNLRLSEMGLDSLTAIELRRWFGHVFGLQI